MHGQLYWQCRRGMRELDLLLLSFLEEGYKQLDAQQRQCFEQLLKTPDPLLLEWLMGRDTPRDRELQHVVKEIRNCVNHQTESIPNS